MKGKPSKADRSSWVSSNPKPPQPESLISKSASVIHGLQQPTVIPRQDATCYKPCMVSYDMSWTHPLCWTVLLAARTAAQHSRGRRKFNLVVATFRHPIGWNYQSWTMLRVHIHTLVDMDMSIRYLCVYLHSRAGRPYIVGLHFLLPLYNLGRCVYVVCLCVYAFDKSALLEGIISEFVWRDLHSPQVASAAVFFKSP